MNIVRRHARYFVAGLVLLIPIAVLSISNQRKLVLVEAMDSPVLTIHSPGAEGNKFGFECGHAVKVHGVYHMFITELCAPPLYVNMRLAHWSSPDRLHWRRVATLYTSSGDMTGRDPRAVVAGTWLAYDDKEQRWNLFYTAYRATPDLPNRDGSIWRAGSKAKGMDGIGGPYADVGIVLQPGPESQVWESVQGTDSFFAYKVGEKWYSFYGSADYRPVKKEDRNPKETIHPDMKGPWSVGLIQSPSLAGPWKRLPTNPVPIHERFIECPIVTKLADGTYVAVYDSEIPNSVGYTFSSDGIHWSPGEPLILQPKGRGHWADAVRTPLGLIPEANGTFTLLYTGFQHNPSPEAWAGGDEAVGVVSVKLSSPNWD